MGTLKFSKAEWCALALSAAALVFLAGWYVRGQAGESYTVSVGLPATDAPGPSQSFLPQATVELNAATLSDLLTLPGIGETRAQAILDYREAHGPFTWPEELLEVPGIGQSLFDRLEPYVTIASPAPSP